MKTKRVESADNPENGLLRDARVYLSGPMDFVASRAAEKATGWRTRIGQFLREMGVVVFDPWEKPEVRAMHEYGREGEGTTDVRVAWTYKGGEEGAAARAHVAEGFWPALHIDLRMVDTSDFIICYCPTNVYSVGRREPERHDVEAGARLAPGAASPRPAIGAVRLYAWSATSAACTHS